MSFTEGAKFDYERLQMYGFGVEYPDIWEVELGPRSTPDAGDIAFRTRGIRIFLSWGPLEEKRKQFQTLDAQVDDSFKRMKKGAEVRKLEVVDRKETTVHGHRSIFNSVKLTLGAGPMAMKTSKREVCSLHFYCEPSRKFFALYADGMAEGSFEHFSEIFFHMSSTLSCHE